MECRPPLAAPLPPVQPPCALCATASQDAEELLASGARSRQAGVLAAAVTSRLSSTQQDLAFTRERCEQVLRHITDLEAQAVRLKAALAALAGRKGSSSGVSVVSSAVTASGAVVASVAGWAALRAYDVAASTAAPLSALIGAGVGVAIQVAVSVLASPPPNAWAEAALPELQRMASNLHGAAESLRTRDEALEAAVNANLRVVDMLRAVPLGQSGPR